MQKFLVMIFASVSDFYFKMLCSLPPAWAALKVPKLCFDSNRIESIFEPRPGLWEDVREEGMVDNIESLHDLDVQSSIRVAFLCCAPCFYLSSYR